MAAGAISGIIAGQYGILTYLTLSGHTDQLRGSMFRWQDVVRDAIFGGIGGAIGYGIQRGLSGIAEDILQNITNSANKRLATNPSLAKRVLTRPEYAAGQANPSVARLEYGRAVEGLVAQDIRKSPILRNLYEYTGQRPSSPDFVGQHIFSGLRFDVTTDTARSISEHLARPYGPGLIFSTYL